MTTTAPSMDNMRKNNLGHWVEITTIKAIDLARDDLVLELVDKVKKMSTQLALLKVELMGDVQAFIELSAEEYGVTVGGAKGNVTLMSFDGELKVQRQITESLSFDERLQAAKLLIDECIHDWAPGSSAEIKTLIDHAFQVDKEGTINTGRVLGLRRLDIQHEKWREAMNAISDSIQVVGSKPYVRIYEKNKAGKFEPISLDIAGL